MAWYVLNITWKFARNIEQLLSKRTNDSSDQTFYSQALTVGKINKEKSN